MILTVTNDTAVSVYWERRNCLVTQRRRATHVHVNAKINLLASTSTCMEGFTIICTLWPLLGMNYSASCTNPPFTVDPRGNRPQGALSRAS